MATVIPRMLADSYTTLWDSLLNTPPAVGLERLERRPAPAAIGLYPVAGDLAGT